MLVIKLKKAECILIGPEIRVVVNRISDSEVRLAIDAAGQIQKRTLPPKKTLDVTS